MTDPTTRAEIQAATTGGKISGIAIALVLTLIVVLVGIGIYVTFPSAGNHFLALVAIGIMGLIVSVLAGLLQAATRDPAIARSASAGAFWFGVVVLLGAGLVAPDSVFTGNPSDVANITLVGLRIVYIIIVLFVVVAGLLLMRWQLYGKAADLRREANRSAWRQATGSSTASPGASSANDPRNFQPPK